TPGKRIDPATRTDSTLAAVQTGRVRVRATRAELAARGTTSGVAAKAAVVVFQCEEPMFHPGMADLFESLVVTGSAAHPIKILWHDWVIGIGQLKPIKWLVAVVTGSCCHGQTDLCSGTAEFLYIG